MRGKQQNLRVLALSKHGNQFRAVVARPNDAMWVFGGDDPNRLSYLQTVNLWPDSYTAPEPSQQEVADAVASFGRQRETD